MSTEHTKQNQHDTGTSQDCEANRKTANTDTNGIMSVYVEGLGGPEHEHREEVGSRDKGDDQGQTQGPRLLLQTGGEDGVFSTIDLPEGKSNQHKEAEDEGSEDVSRAPGVLLEDKGKCVSTNEKK